MKLMDIAVINPFRVGQAKSCNNFVLNSSELAHDSCMFTSINCRFREYLRVSGLSQGAKSGKFLLKSG